MLSVPTGRKPQQSLHGPAPGLAQASPCAGAACPSLDVERATVSSQASSQHLLEAGANSVI